MLQFLTAKTLTIFFALATTAFCIATIVLAVENSNLENDLAEALEKLDQILQTTTTTTTSRTTIVTTTSVKPTENPSTSTTTTDSSSTTNATENLPTYPTLPPNLPDPGKYLTAKTLTVFFALTATAFCIATIVVAVEKSNLENELAEALDKLDQILQMTTTPGTSTSEETTIVTTTVETTEDSSTAPVTTENTSTSITTTPGTSTSEETTIVTTTVETTEDSSTAPVTTENTSTSITTTPGTPTSEETTIVTTTLETTEDSSTAPVTTVKPPQQRQQQQSLPQYLQQQKITYRLLDDIRPIRYNLQWHPDLEYKTCEATASIQIEIDNETNLIVMHSLNLEIHSITVLNMMARIRIRVRQWYLDHEREMLFIELDELLYRATPYTITISYSFVLNGLNGVYTSSYRDENGEERPRFCRDKKAGSAVFTLPRCCAEKSFCMAPKHGIEDFSQGPTMIKILFPSSSSRYVNKMS
uniref:Aminopeptidase N-like N-terminal domain-containing protein n=1 Tax=Glossina austeni TaxID=7395 RepID=A0A1A9VKP3_GLOAU